MNGIWKDELSDGVVIISKLNLGDLHIVIQSHFDTPHYRFSNFYMLNCSVTDKDYIITDYILNCDFDIVAAQVEAIELLKSLSVQISNGLSLLEIEE